jgi:hypothetical protein
VTASRIKNILVFTQRTIVTTKLLTRTDDDIARPKWRRRRLRFVDSYRDFPFIVMLFFTAIYHTNDQTQSCCKWCESHCLLSLVEKNGNESSCGNRMTICVCFLTICAVFNIIIVLLALITLETNGSMRPSSRKKVRAFFVASFAYRSFIVVAPPFFEWNSLCRYFLGAA